MHTTARMWLGVLTVFTCGLVIGAFIGNYFTHRHLRNMMSQIKDTRGGVFVDITMDRLEDVLDLSPKQQAEIKPILAETFRKAHQLHESLRERMDATMDAAEIRIKTHLTPDQIMKIDQAHGIRGILPGPPPEGHPRKN